MSNGAMTLEILKSLDEDCPWCCNASLEVAIGTEDLALVEYIRCPNRECGYMREGGSFPREPIPTPASPRPQGPRV